MDIETLRTFITLADTNSFTKTANQLFVAQSTVTNRINELEKELKISLFNRTNRSVKLTIEGERFKIYAQKVLDLTENTLADMTAEHKYENHIRIGSADSIYEGHLAPEIQKYRNKHPENSLKITIGLSNHLLEQLQEDLLDAAFVYIPLKKSSFHSELYKQDRLVLVTDINNKKYRKGITQQQLIEENYLMCNFALQDVGQYIRKLFPRFHQFELEIDDCMKIVPYLLGKDNYTFLPKDMADTYIKDKKLREIPLLDFDTPIINSYIIYKDSMKDIISKLIKIK
ncbi:LysR family transcriptional regulator, repressor for citA [Lachnospiraceae bacterium NE2001]|nr:LysR family transcriptional regulator, repressor for citA [Lachnospiraceae bacterium NE2001]